MHLIYIPCKIAKIKGYDQEIFFYLILLFTYNFLLKNAWCIINHVWSRKEKNVFRKNKLQFFPLRFFHQNLKESRIA